jgi:hypothetical protein
MTKQRATNAKNLRRQERNIEKRNINTEESKNTAKEILDKYATIIVRTNAIYEKDGEPGVDQTKTEIYDSEHYDTDIILQIPPKDYITLEFEDSTENNSRYIQEIEASAKSLGYDYAITGHGGKSDYFRMANIKGMPVNYLNKIAKDLLIDTLLPSGAKKHLDKTNLGWTLSPVIGHPHWKPKYNGAIHRHIRGKPILEHKNSYPKELLKKIKNAQQWTRKHTENVKKSSKWVEDFLLNYCTKNLLPGGQRHFVIEKNLVALIYHREDYEIILEQYLQAQQRKSNTCRTWFNAISNGNYSEISPGELLKFINDHDVPYVIPSELLNENEKKPLTTEEKQTIRTHLTKPSLLVDIIKEVQSNGVEREEITILAEIIISCTRLVKKVNAESKNLLLSDKTGLGKDYVTSKTLEVILPEDQHLHVTKMTPEAFTYWKNPDKFPDWTWDDKVIHFEDISSQILNCSTFKVMASGGSTAVVVKDQNTIEIPINGKPCMILTSHHANPGDENLRRFPIGGLNESVEQTQRIKEKVAQKYSGRFKTISNDDLRRSIKELRSFEVVIPYAEIIQYFFPNDTLMRTHFKRFLDYICASAVFHQGQRKLVDGHLIAEPDDYMIARVVLIYTSSFERMTPISKEYRDVIEIFKNENKTMSIMDMYRHPEFNHSKMWLYRHLPKLTELRIIKKEFVKSTDANKNVEAYSYANLNAQSIPTWEKIIEIIKSVETVKTVKTDNTNNSTTGENKYIKWFSQPLLKPVLTPLLKPPNGRDLTVFTVFTVFLRERDEENYKKYYETVETVVQKEKIQESLDVLHDDKDTNMKKTNVDLVQYTSTIRSVENVVSDRPINLIEIGIRMNKTNPNELDFIQGLVNAAIDDPDFLTPLKRTGNGLYFKEVA